ncbi:helix-turn-helix transcriptional regulator [Bradyrhizobium sp. SZCCHNPS2010]|uniref:helix-turn-helix domain-containing protein n=1 Tax=Bradyrhizobium sp. SZCCHNPS2010 TaxID=3057333 RepID=UPI00291621E9|nr:helix-turn-helix transcriptional regulator [Bradyrhizobium sp. SZCCHNPS2010]
MMPPKAIITGADLKDWRWRCKLTAEQAARAIGVSRATIHRLQNAHHIPRTEAIAAESYENILYERFLIAEDSDFRDPEPFALERDGD